MNEQDILNNQSWLEVWHHYYDPELELEQNDPNAICISSVSYTHLTLPTNREV